MTRRNQTLLLLGLFACFAFAPQSAEAAKGPVYETSHGAHMTKKLIRGVENILCSFVEVPKEIILEWQRTDPFTGIWLGFGRGVYMMGRRLCFGIYDIVTFGFRLPWDDRIDPEVVLLDRID